MQIKISVSDPQVRKEYGGMKQFYIYSIKGQDQKGPFEIQRRYSDFDLLRSTIFKRWPGYFVPSLPSKVKLNNSDQEFLEIRSLYLQKFLRQVAQKSIIWYSEQMQFFVRINNLNCQKVLGTFSKVDYREIAYRYSSNLKKFKNSHEPKHVAQIQNFQKQLQGLFVKIQELRVKYEEIYNSQRKYHKNYARLLSTLFQGYESKVRHVEQSQKLMGRKQCAENREKMVEQLKEVPLHGIFQEIKRQKREVMAFQQVFLNRRAYQKEIKQIQIKIKEKQAKIQELRGGKQSFMAKIRKADTSSEIAAQEKSIQKYKQELKTLNQIFNYVNWILAEEQITFFKKQRVSSYYKMVKALAVEQLKITTAQRQFWSLIFNQHHGFQIEQKKVVQGVEREKIIKEDHKEQAAAGQQKQNGKVSPRQQKNETSPVETKEKQQQLQYNRKQNSKDEHQSGHNHEQLNQQENGLKQNSQELHQEPQFASKDNSIKEKNQIKSPQITEEQVEPQIIEKQVEPQITESQVERPEKLQIEQTVEKMYKEDASIDKPAQQ